MSFQHATVVFVLAASTLGSTLTAQRPPRTYITISLGSGSLSSQDLWSVNAQPVGRFDAAGFLTGIDSVSLTRATRPTIEIGASLTHQLMNHISLRLGMAYGLRRQDTGCTVRFKALPGIGVADSLCQGLDGRRVTTRAASLDIGLLTHRTFGRFAPGLVAGFGAGHTVGLDRSKFLQSDGADQLFLPGTVGRLNLYLFWGAGVVASITHNTAVQVQVRNIVERNEVAPGPGNLLGQVDGVPRWQGRYALTVGLVVISTADTPAATDRSGFVQQFALSWKRNPAQFPR